MAIVLLIALLLGTSAYAEYKSYWGDLYWVLDDNGELVITGNGQMEGFTDSGEAWNKYKSSIKTVTIGQGITNISQRAFNCPNLTHITIPNSVTDIGGSAFNGCTCLKSVLLPDSINSIGSYAFSGCTSLVSITLPESLNTIGPYAFEECDSLNQIHISSIDSWLSIEYDDSFESHPNYNKVCGLYIGNEPLTSIIIPDNITSICDLAFYGFSNIVSIIIPETVSEIGYFAFYGCTGLTDIIIPNGISSIENFLFNGCKKLRSVVLPNTITSIGYSAFQNCSSLISITIPDGVTFISDYAFDGCTNLTTIEIPDSVTRINSYAFRNCKGLTDIVIPRGITRISSYTFSDCTNLRSILVPDNITYIGDFAFSHCSNLTEIHVSSIESWLSIKFGNLESRPNYNPYVATSFLYIDDTEITNLIIPDTFATISSYAFYNFGGFTQVTIPSSVTMIDSSAFAKCSGLTSIIIPNTVYTIKESAFSGCSGLVSITLSSRITRIENGTFNGCSSLLSIAIPENVISIGEYAFMRCNSLKEIVIPLRVTEIGRETFYRCESLENVVLPNGIVSIGEYAFYNCINLKNLVIPESVTNIDKGAFYACNALESIMIPSGVDCICQETFSGCSNLKSIKISNGVTSIEKYAFSECRNLANLTLPESVKNIYRLALSSCSRLNKLVILSKTTNFDSNQALNDCCPIVYCYRESDADTWANYQNLPIVYLDYFDPDTEREISLPFDELRLKVNNTYNIMPNVFPDYDQPTIIWNTDNPSIANVQDGMIEAIGLGTCIITATVGNATASMSIIVIGPATDMYFENDEIWIINHDSMQLQLIIVPDEAEPDLVWNSIDPTIVTVNTDGVITACSIGETTVTVTDENGLSSSALIHVCNPVTEINFPNNTIVANINQEIQLSVNVQMGTQSCINHLVTFTTSDETVAIVNNDGLLRTLKKGRITITATSASGISASCAITIIGNNRVIVPESTKIIENEAFANLPDVDIIELPSGLESIADNAFDGSVIIIIAPEGSYAETWANNHNIPFIKK